MRDRARIFKAGTNSWIATRPAYGFNPQETRACRSFSAAIAWLDTCRASSESGSYDLSGQVHDGIGSTPAWTPLWPHG